MRIVSGNAALGATEAGAVDVVAMDDFIYAEPVATAGLTIGPGSTTMFRTARFDLVLAIGGYAAPLVTGRIVYDGLDVTASLLGCLRPGTLVSGGVTFRCALPGSLLSAGDHTPQRGTGLRRRVTAPQRHPVGGRRQYRTLAPGVDEWRRHWAGAAPTSTRAARHQRRPANI